MSSCQSRPDTYFIQRAVEKGLRAIEARLDVEEGYRPRFLLQLSPVPQLQHSIWDLGDMCSRYVDAGILGQQAVGHGLPEHIDLALRGILFGCDPYLEPFMATRMMITYVDVYLQNPTHENKERVEDLVALVRSRMTFEDDYAYYFRQPEGWSSQTQVMGHFIPYPTYPIGGLIIGLSRYLEVEQSEDARDLNDRLCKFVLDISGTFDMHGRYRGHTHSGGILTAVAGILRWAINRGDDAVVERMKKAFDYTLQHSGSTGWIPDGLGESPGSCETCTLMDAIHAAILLARNVDTGYYDFIERCVRNQLLENQILKPERFMGEIIGPEMRAVADALTGSWASYSLPNSLDNCSESVEGCCLGSGIRGLCLALDAAIEKRREWVQVNIPFSRNSEWCEVISYEPYVERMDIIMHDDSKVRVRIPAWVDRRDVRVSVDGDLVEFDTSSDLYIEIGGGYAGRTICMEYPLRKVKITENIDGQEYVLDWRGNTVVGIEPRGSLYPIYERELWELESW